jgi:hypothetical protein
VKTFHGLSTGQNRNPDTRSKREKAGGHSGQGVKIPSNSGPVTHKRAQIATPNPGEQAVQFDDGFDVKRGL